MDDMGCMTEENTPNEENEENDVELSSPSLCDLSLSEVGQAFWSWVQGEIIEGRLTVNTPESYCHRVNEQIFLISEPLMRLFVTQYGVGIDERSHLTVQQGFQSLGLHIKNKHRDMHTAILSAGSVYGYLLPWVDALQNAFSSVDSPLSMEAN